MKNIKILGAERRYGVSAVEFERQLAKLGWIIDGQLCGEAVREGYLTKDKEITARGDGFLYGILILWSQR